MVTKLPVIKRPEFTTYLEAFGPRKVVGITGDAQECPIARYLTEHFGLQEVEVVFSSYNALDEDGSLTSRKTAEWLNDFIIGIDDEEDETKGDYLPVTAKHALHVLSGVR